MKVEFSEMPSAGMFEDRPQFDLEGYEERGKIEGLMNDGLVLDCGWEVTYQCLDLRKEGYE